MQVLHSPQDVFSTFMYNEIYIKAQTKDEFRSRYDALQRSVCDLTAQFLATERVVELSSGQPLKQCFLVRVNNELRVEEVVMEGKAQRSA